MDKIIDFGMHKGRSYLEVPIDYLVYMKTLINKDKQDKKTYNKKRLEIIEYWLEERYLENNQYDKSKEWSLENQKAQETQKKKAEEINMDIPEDIAKFIIDTYGYDFSHKISIEIEKQIKLDAFYNQKLTTVEEYLNLYPDKKDNLSSILIECGTMTGLQATSKYITEKKHTIMIFSYFSKREMTYMVDVIYTPKEYRNKTSARSLLSNLNFIGSLYFDTYTESLIHLLKDLGAVEEEIFKNKPSTQLVLELQSNT